MTRPANPRPAGDLHSLKQRNRLAILDALRCRPDMTRTELARDTGLTKVTVGSAVMSLLESGWLEEGELQRRRGGRPGRSLSLSEHHHLLLGAEIGVHELRLVACTLSGETLLQRCIARAGTTPDEAAAQLAGEITALLVMEGLKARQLLGLGVALPGPVMPNEPLLGLAPNLGWHRVRFLDLLAGHLPELPGIQLMDNESSLAAFGELYFARDHAPASLLFVSADIGIGSGLVENGAPPRIIRGVHGLAGEIGHTLLDPNGARCHCGNDGCAETLVSGWRLRQQLDIDESDDLISAVTALPASRTGPVLERAGQALGMLLHNLHHTLNPAAIVIGGTLTELGPAFMAPALARFAATQRRLLPEAGLITPRVLANSRLAPARGAAAMVMASALAALELSP
ncbi:Sugar kinase of the NBD/HSP70 family, may contain an N-terminal HTH domain [Kushneria avicenniae]|uniref:Sugar kinase of the NBD/HSP70 family, may contain an N-terminal HTH domain n=1 Tax=Kushneria avicenniae TaxID=402385 RepID=A0A1I1JYE7_9GAMM|nr:ROK family transcriptional regulator [Kushneria avicenniae]SFC53395.1 Sugar kinase of the NBD/HSP70 family, may contain an N-terminal HTH domain [Kushneria avicenniae]